MSGTLMKDFTGTGRLLRLNLRRDRIMLPAWITIFVTMTVASSSATMALYPSQASRISAAAAINDVPTFVALYGRVWDPTSLGELSLVKMSGMGTVFLAILAIFLVTRHTRADEEAGRTELIGSLPVGRWAHLASALLVAIIALTAIGLLSAAGLALVGLPLAGSLAFGLAWIMTGLAFAIVAAGAAEVTTSARTANALALMALAVAFVLRGIGDATGSSIGPTAWSWFSPIGWAQQVRAFADDRYVVLLLPAAFAVVMLTVVFTVNGRRDLGSGLLPDRAGNGRAGRLLRSPWGLAWHQQRWLLTAWVAAYVGFSWLIGSIVSDLGSMLNTPQAQAFITALGGSEYLVDSFIALEFGFLAFATSAYGIAAVRRLAAEEATGHAELVLAASVPRLTYLFSHVTIAILGTILLTAVQGLAFAAADAMATGSSDRLWPTFAAALAWLPAVWVMTALAVAITGFAPRLIILAWGALVAMVLVSELGALLSWPQWILDASPSAHVPLVPSEPMNWVATLVLAAIAGVLMLAGAWRYSRRDLTCS